jgi:hypothetical protein
VIAHNVNEIHERMTGHPHDGGSADMHRNERAPAE